MLTPFRHAPVRFTHLAPILCFLAVGSFDTLKAQSLTVSSTNLAFTAAQGANPNPINQTVNVGSTGANLVYNISLTPSGSWLSASAQTGFGGSSSGTTPDQINVQINSTSLPSGSYSGTITLTPTVGSAVTISVALTISGSGNTTSFLSAAPSQLSFGYELHQVAPPSQATQITSSGISLPLSFSVNTAPTSNCPSGWFQAALSSNTTPASLTVSIVTTGLGPGSCTGAITVSSNTPTNGTTSTLIGVTLFVSSGALLNITIPTGLQSLTLQQGARPVQFSTTNNPPNPIVLSSSDPNQQLTFTLAETTNSGFNWLSIAPSSNSTPANVNVQITPGSVLAVGTYTGTITVTSSGLLNNTTSIPITLNITSASSVSISPNTPPTFTGQQLGSVPASQTLTLTGPAAQSPTFTTSVIQQSGGAWLQISPSSGSLTATPNSSSAPITLSVNPNIYSTLQPGSYSSQAVISFANSAIPQIVLTANLIVQLPTAALLATPSAVTFTYQAGGPLPGAQTVAISNPASGPLPYTVASVSDSWFSVSPNTGNTPGSVTVAVSPQSLQPGNYSGSFTLTSPGAATTTVNVALFISASSSPTPFIISNAASGVGGQISPGEIITIKGSGLGPGTPVSFTLSSLSNPVLGGAQVTFNGISGTLLYVSSTQINVTVPYGIAGSATVAIIVIYQGVQSTPISQPVAATSPGLFTDNSSGSGQAAVVNQNFTYNTPATPAPQGSVISVYATGGGQTNPSSFDGEVSPTTSLLPLVLQPSVTATIGGKPATVTFAGAAPGYVTGVVQLNIQVPAGATGILPILVTINGLQSQAGATVAVQ